MLDRFALEGMRPVKVASVSTIELLTKKSSAVSVSVLPALGRRESVATFPSGLPVEKKKGSADAWEINSSEASAPRAVFVNFVLFCSFFITCNCLLFVFAHLTGPKLVIARVRSNDSSHCSIQIRFAFGSM